MKICTRISLGLLVTLCSCVQVNPAPDFEKARLLVQESTGMEGLFQPEKQLQSSEELIAEVRDGLSLDEAVSIALLNNRQLQRDVLEIGVSHADMVQAGLLSNPVFTLLLKFPDGGGRSNLESGFAQSISDLWKLPSRKRAARWALDATILRVARRAGEVVGAVRAAYYETLAASELVETARSRAALAGDVSRAVKVLKDAGAVGALDENLANGELLRAELELKEAQLSERNELRNLSQLLSLDLSAEELRGKLEHPTEELSAGPCEFDTKALLSMARAHRLDLKALENSVEQAESLVRLAKRSLIPDLGLGAVFERPEQAAGEEEGEVDYLLGPELSLEIPLFDQNQAQLASAHFRRDQAKKELEAAQLRLIGEVEEAIDQVRTARQALGFFRMKLLPQAERNLEYARVAYEGGQSGLLTLMESQRTLLDARRGWTAVRLQSRKAFAELVTAVGTQTLGDCRNKVIP